MDMSLKIRYANSKGEESIDSPCNVRFNANHIQDSKLDNQAILRDNISRLYRYIKSSKHQYILDQDLQNYISMFDRYSKDHGNGYVHDIVDPYMRSLPVFLSTEQAEEYFNEK